MLCDHAYWLPTVKPDEKRRLRLDLQGIVMVRSPAGLQVDFGELIGELADRRRPRPLPESIVTPVIWFVIAAQE